MTVGYAITNALTGLAATAFTWSSGYTTGRGRLNDGEQDELASGSSSAQASGQYLQIDFGSATALAAIALLNHNLTGCTVLIEGADDSGMSVNKVTAKGVTVVSTTAPYNKDCLLQFVSVTKRYWRLTFAHSGTKTITLGEVLCIASITTLSRNYIYGFGESERYVLNRNSSRTGHTRSTFLGGPIRSKRFAFKDLQGTSERNELMTMWRATRGGNARLLWVDMVDSDNAPGGGITEETQWCLWGRLSESLGWTGPDFNLFDVDGFELVGEGREVGS